MLLTSLVLILISNNLVLSSQYHLEAYYGYVHDDVLFLSQAKCLAQCSIYSNCCAFSFIIGVANECHIYRNCSQSADLNSVDIMKAYYKKDVDPTTQEPKTTIPTTIPSTTTTQTTKKTTTTTTVAAIPITKPKPPVVQVPAVPAPAPVIPPPKPAVPAPPKVGTPKPVAPTPPPKPCPIFSYSPCQKADKTIFQSANIAEPFNPVGDSQWNFCPTCKEHARKYPNAHFDKVYSDYAWLYAITYRSKSNVCDLIVECNLDFPKNSLWINGWKWTPKHFWIRITWNGSAWESTWDGNFGLPEIVTSVQCAQ